MKKIININLSGRVIPIEDSAYEKLQGYIESLRRYFSKEEDRDEIINDIESRIAELMNEKLRKGATHITDADIDEIAASMGRPEDFEADTTEPKGTTANQGSTQQSYTERKTRRRLYRDTNDKFIGGVCSGIAAYLNIDPSIIRILFAIITFGGFGLGFLAYIILWIVLPPKNEEGYTGKRLYRNPDDRVIGGVSGGLAAYFGRETWVIRLIFAAPFLFSILLGIIRGLTWQYDFDFVPNIVFGSLGSTFVLTYIILWIVLPEARSTYEKMEMRGEKVDVNTIRQNMKERVKDWADEVKTSAENIGNRAKEFADTKGKTFAREAGETVRRGGSGIGHAIGVVFKAFFLFIAGTIAFGLFVGLMALLFGGIAWWPINNFLWTSKWQQIYAWGTLIFFLAVPLIAFIVWLIRRIIGIRSRNNYLGWTFGFLWCLGWVSGTLLFASMTKDFRDFEHAPDQKIEIVQPSTGKMIVAVTEPALEYTGNFGWISDGEEGWDLTTDTLKLSLVDFKIEKSVDSMYHVTLQKYSCGRTYEDAVTRANNYNYTISSRDSILDLASGYAIDKKDKFRAQRVLILIQVPAGKKIRFDQTVRTKLNPTNIKYRGNRRRDHVEFVFNDNASFWWRSNRDYIMQEDGQLTDTEGNKIANDGGNYYYDDRDDRDDRRNDRENRRNDNNRQYENRDRNDSEGGYRYEQDPKDSSGVERELEEARKKKQQIEKDNEENERRIQELEKKRKETQTPASKQVKAGSEDGAVAKNNSHVLSLADTFF